MKNHLLILLILSSFINNAQVLEAFSKYTFKENWFMEFAENNDLKAADKISKEEVKLFSLDSISKYHPQVSDSNFYFGYSFKISTELTGAVFRFKDSHSHSYSLLAVYDKQLELKDSKIISYFISEDDDQNSFFKFDQLTIKTHKGNGTSHRRFLFHENGKIKPFVGKSRNQLKELGILADSRIVKARNGLIIRDENKERIGKFEFGDRVDILEYISDTIAIKDEGKIYAGRWARVVLEYYNLLKHLQVPTYDYKVGYVFEGFLFRTKADQERYAIAQNKELPLYACDNLSFNTVYSTNLDVSTHEFLDLERVELEDYTNQIIHSESIHEREYGQTNAKEKILDFENGKKRRLKDTVFENNEYSPLLYFKVFEKKHFQNQYLILNSFFEGHHFDLLDKRNGDTISSFSDYPFQSPKKKLAICVNTPFSYDEGVAHVEIIEHKNGRYVKHCSLDFTNWNITKNKQIYWLSDKEFILKVKEVEDAFSDEKNARYFYLKIKLKE